MDLRHCSAYQKNVSLIYGSRKSDINRLDYAPLPRQKNPCKTCDWRGICLFDDRMDASRVRRFPGIRAESVLERLKLEEKTK